MNPAQRPPWASRWAVEERTTEVVRSILHAAQSRWQPASIVGVHNTTDAPSGETASSEIYDRAMSDSQLIAKIGETVWGASWQAAMATAVRQSRYTIEAWASGREPVPLEMWKELREATRLHYLKLADLDAEIVRAFDDAYQRAMAGKR
jgi:hypothetical protein